MKTHTHTFYILESAGNSPMHRLREQLILDICRTICLLTTIRVVCRMWDSNPRQVVSGNSAGNQIQPMCFDHSATCDPYKRDCTVSEGMRATDWNWLPNNWQFWIGCFLSRACNTHFLYIGVRWEFSYALAQRTTNFGYLKDNLSFNHH